MVTLISKFKIKRTREDKRASFFIFIKDIQSQHHIAMIIMELYVNKYYNDINNVRIPESEESHYKSQFS